MTGRWLIVAGVFYLLWLVGRWGWNHPFGQDPCTNPVEDRMDRSLGAFLAMIMFIVGAPLVGVLVYGVWALAGWVT